MAGVVAAVMVEEEEEEERWEENGCIYTPQRRAALVSGSKSLAWSGARQVRMKMQREVRSEFRSGGR